MGFELGVLGFWGYRVQGFGAYVLEAVCEGLGFAFARGL